MDAPRWLAVAAVADLGRTPLRVEADGAVLVVWRAGFGRVAVFHDRCPHRAMPLSDGRRTLTGRLVCDHHGWEFAADGRCLKAPTGTPRPADVVPSRVVDGRIEVLLPTPPGADGVAPGS